MLTVIALIQLKLNSCRDTGSVKRPAGAKKKQKGSLGDSEGTRHIMGHMNKWPLRKYIC